MTAGKLVSVLTASVSAVDGKEGGTCFAFISLGNPTQHLFLLQECLSVRTGQVASAHFSIAMETAWHTEQRR